MTDMEVENIKDVPGYKVILKAVIKSQVQQLFEQLAVHTDEESIVLTASVADGTLSHLGSKSGKGFLDNNEDIKSQFLGYCLRNKHRLVSQNSQETECRLIHPTITGHVTSSLKLMSPEKHSYSSNCYTRSSRIRHKPYANGRTSDRKSLNAEQRNEALISKSSTLSEDAESLSELQDTVCVDNVEIKAERLDNFKDACTFKERPKAKNNETFVKEVSEIKSKDKDPEIFQNEAQELRGNINQIPIKETSNCQQKIVSVSCVANLANHSNDKSQINSGSDVEMIQEVDDTTVKVEEISESELEIEITDVKSLGSQAEEKSNHSTNMTFDPHVAVSGPRDGTTVLTSVDGTTPQSRREPNTLSRDLLFDSLNSFQLQDHLDKCLHVDIRDLEQFGEGSEESDRGDEEYIPTEGSEDSHTADEDDILDKSNEKSVTEDEHIMQIKDNEKLDKSGDKVYSNTVPLQANSNDSGIEGELINKSVNQYKHTIMVATCKKSKDGKRLWDKKHSCVYCHKQYLKLARHLEYIHKNEPEVQRALAFEKNSKERKAVWKTIMNKGNFAHNTKVFECKEGEIIPQKRPTKARDASKYVICDICYGTYIKSDMWRHVKNCRPEGDIKNSRKQKKPSGCQCCINASF